LNGQLIDGETIRLKLALTEKVLAAIITLVVAGWGAWVSSSNLDVKEDITEVRLVIERMDAYRFTSRDGIEVTSRLADQSERISVLEQRINDLERDFARFRDIGR
jgi:cell division protein FtsL